MDYCGEVVNFASFLRVSGMRHLSQHRAWVTPLSLVRSNASAEQLPPDGEKAHPASVIRDKPHRDTF